MPYKSIHFHHIIVYTFVRHESELPKDIFIRCAHLVKKDTLCPELFSGHILFHSVCKESLEFSVFVTIDKISVYCRMRVGKGGCFFQPHHHESCSQGICCHAIFGNDGSGKDIVLYRISCSRINGVCILFSVFIIKITVISRCGKSCIA